MGGCLLTPNYQLTLSLLLFLLYSLVFSCLSLSSSSSPPPAHLCHNDESTALLQFKLLFSFNCSVSYCSNYPSKTDNWKEGTDCCAWDGVTCHNTTAHVIGLNLNCSCLYGTIPPNSTLFNLLHLQHLDLFGNNFNHSQILPSFGRFTNLKYLDLGWCYLSGQIQSSSKEVSQGNNFPNSIFHLPKLQVLYLDSNTEITGKLPSFINGTLRNIRTLWLSRTGLTGELPNSIGQLEYLEELDLENCIFSGTIPRSLGNLTRLTYLCLSSIYFSGKLPSSLGNLTRLIYLDLSANHFSGKLPSSLGNLTRLTHLDLSANYFSGKLPSSLSYLENLYELYLLNNNFEGPFSQPFNLSQLHYLYYSSNQLTGPIPSSIIGLPHLEILDLSNNSINGTIPSSLFHLVNLTGLYLSSNNLCGTVELDRFAKLENLQILDLSNSGLSLTTTNFTHSSFPNISTLRLSSCNISKILEFLKNQNELLQELDLSNNKINEELNPLMCNLHSLRYLDLSNNQLCGLIPSCLGNFRNLTTLNLQRNNFNGTIPQIFGYTSKLDTLDISHNGFQGVLPISLANCTNLEILNVGHNLIEDAFPFWLENLPQLKVIVLRDNKFHGPIGQPRNRTAFTNLHIIDVSHNDFTGKLPSKYFESWHLMMMADEDKSHLNYIGNNHGYYSVTIMNKGLEMVLVKIITIFKAVDFSHNKFHGKIPISIGRLKALCVLNFSGNGLTVSIPMSLGNLTELESLDLSQNKLSGEIPQELTCLTFLAVLDVSENNLTGLIPQGRQFATFSNTSYEGNPGLCGSPLSKKCKNLNVAKSPSLPSPLSHNFKFKLDGFGWEAVLMGYGCGVVLGLVIGSCIIRRKEEWIVRIFGVKMCRQKKRSKNVRYQHGRR